MRIAIAADHAGFALKERLRARLANAGHDVLDCGTNSAAAVDYPDYAEQVAAKVLRGEVERGILVCSTGVGMCIAANKIRGIRAALAVQPEAVRFTRAHNDANVLTLGARFTSEPQADEMVKVFLNTAFDGGRHARRLEKISKLEEQRQV